MIQNTAMAAALLVSFGVGAGIGATVVHFNLNAQVTCATPLIAPPRETVPQGMLKPTAIPLTGYRTY